MKADLDRTKGSFKLDLLETANVDPMLSGADYKVLSAYVFVMDWPSCRTWLATSLAIAMTGLSERQFRDSRNVLRGGNKASRAYLMPARRGGNVSAYTLVNPWRDEARAHVDAMVGYQKEVARQKKALQRANLSRQILPGQEVDCPGKDCRSVPANSAAYYPSVITPKKKGRRSQNDSGSNVLPFTTNPRKAS